MGEGRACAYDIRAVVTGEERLLRTAGQVSKVEAERVGQQHVNENNAKKNTSAESSPLAVLSQHAPYSLL